VGLPPPLELPVTAPLTLPRKPVTAAAAAAHLNLLDLLRGDPGNLLDHGVACVGAAAVAVERALPLPILLASLLGHAFLFLSFDVASMLIRSLSPR